MTVKSVSSALALGLLVSGAPSRLAPAATPAASFGVSAIVQDTCLVSTSDVKVSTHAEEMAKAIFAVSVKCTNFTPYNIGMSVSPVNDSAGVRRVQVAADPSVGTVAVTIIY